MKSRILLSFLMIIVAVKARGQSSFDAFHYQSIIKQSSGIPYSNTSLDIKVELRYSSTTGTILFDEQHNITTNNNGYVSLEIGNGTALMNGLYADFTDIPWVDTLYFFNLYVFNTTSLAYDLASTRPLYTVPFAIFSQSSAQKYSIAQLTDVDTSGIADGSILRWNGTKWLISVDSTYSGDTVVFAYNAVDAVHADTAMYAFNALNIIPNDTANYSYFSDTSAFAYNANHAITSDSSEYAYSADTALFASGMWSTSGNPGTNALIDFVGTTDLNDLHFVTNNQKRMTIKSDGKIGIGTSAPLTDLHIDGKNGLILSGTFGTGAIPTTGAGTRFMWYPKKAAFRGGTLDLGGTSTYWDDIRIGNYSFSFGRNTRAEGTCSVSFGEASSALAPWSMAAGLGSLTNSGAQYSVAIGHSSTCNGLYTVALGRGNTANGIASTAIGYHTTTSGDYSRAFGYYCSTTGDYSTAMGYQAQANHDGSFIYIDYSNVPPYIATTAPNQFLVRAAGGFFFYSNPTMTTGVTLASGSGSWSTLSDSTKKENFIEIDDNDILTKIAKIHIYSWNYKSQHQSIRHIGPTAQQFHKVFGYGENDTTISTVDIDGVNLAGIKALQQKNNVLEEKLANYETLLKELEELKAERMQFIQKLNELENIIEQQLKIAKNK